MSKRTTIIIIALVVSLLASGGAVAAKKITGADVVDESLTGADVQNGSLTAADFSGPLGGSEVKVAASPGPTVPAGTYTPLADSASTVTLSSAGRLLASGAAQVNATCTVVPCTLRVALFLDGQPMGGGLMAEANGGLPGGIFGTGTATRYAAADVSAGQHTVDVRVSADNATVSNNPRVTTSIVGAGG